MNQSENSQFLGTEKISKLMLQQELFFRFSSSHRHPNLEVNLPGWRNCDRMK